MTTSAPYSDEDGTPDNMAKIKITYNDGSFAEWVVDRTLAVKTHQSLPLGNRVGLVPDRPPAPGIKRDLAYLFQDKRKNLLAVIQDLRKSVEAGTMGDYSELGFLSNFLHILMED